MSAEEKPKIGMFYTILNILGLLGIGYSTFMGLMYVSHGITWISFMFAFLFLASLYFLGQYLIVMKLKDRNIKTLIPEMILGGVVLVIFIFALPFCVHYYDVEFGRKDEMIKAGIAKVDLIINLKNDYEEKVEEKIKNYNDNLSTLKFELFKCKDKICIQNVCDRLLPLVGEGPIGECRSFSFGGNTSSIESSIEQAAKGRVADTTRKYKIDSLAAYVQFHSEAKAVFENWSYTKVSRYYYDIDGKYNQFAAKIKNKMPSISIPSAQDIDLHLDDFWFAFTNPVRIFIFSVIVILLFAFVLAPYFSVLRPEGTGLIQHGGRHYVKPNDLKNL